MLKAAGGLGKAAGGLPGLYEKVSSGEAWGDGCNSNNDVTSICITSLLFAVLGSMEYYVTLLRHALTTMEGIHETRGKSVAWYTTYDRSR